MAKVYLVILLALIFRLAIAPLIFNGDTIIQASWAKWIAENGYQSFYTNTHWIFEWPNHPPLISLWYGYTYTVRSFITGILANTGVFIAIHHLGATHFMWLFRTITWLSTDTFKLTNLPYGILYTIKLLPILADLLISLLIYNLAKRISSSKALILMAVYLCSPFSWYLSALWGQSDQVASLFAVVAFLLLGKRYPLVSMLSFCLAINLKPTVIILIPLYLYFIYLNRISWKRLVIGFLISAGLSLWWLSILTTERPIWAATDRLIRVLFFTKEPVTTKSAFNFWYLIHGSAKVLDSSSFLLLSYKIWGLILFLFTNILAIKILSRDDLKRLFYALFLVGFGGWMFLTNMYERYVFIGILAGLIACIYNFKLFKYWLVLSSLYFLNMFFSWYPEELPKSLYIYISGNIDWIGRIISLANLLTFIAVVKQILNDCRSKGLV